MVVPPELVIENDKLMGKLVKAVMTTKMDLHTLFVRTGYNHLAPSTSRPLY